MKQKDDFFQKKQQYTSLKKILRKRERYTSALKKTDIIEVVWDKKTQKNHFFVKKGQYTYVNSRWGFFPTFFPLVSFLLFKKRRYNIVILLWKKKRKNLKFRRVARGWPAFLKKSFFLKESKFTRVFLCKKILKKRILVEDWRHFFEIKTEYYTLFLPKWQKWSVFLRWFGAKKKCGFWKKEVYYKREWQKYKKDCQTFFLGEGLF